MDSGNVACIADANIFIDFSEAGILPKITKAGFRLATTDLVVAELETPTLADLQSIGVTVVTLDARGMRRLLELRFAHQKPSVADLSALTAAEHLDAALLTGDAALRRVAENIGVEVHGTIWLMNHLVQNRTVTRLEATAMLDEMRQRGRRLPPFI